MTAMATTILMLKGEPNVHRSCNHGGSGNGFGIRRSTHPRGAKSGGQNPGCGFWNSEKHSPTGGEIRESKILVTDFGLGKPLTQEGQNPGGQNPGNGFGIRRSTHPRGAKSGRQNPGARSQLRKPVTHNNKKEDFPTSYPSMTNSLHQSFT